jgi:hypothetical protein
MGASTLIFLVGVFAYETLKIVQQQGGYFAGIDYSFCAFEV